MAMRKCRECNAQVSDFAKTCPTCGISRPVKKTSVSTVMIVTLLGGGAAIVIATSNGSSSTKPQSTNVLPSVTSGNSKPAAPRDPWNYGNHIDKMTGNNIIEAATFSTNSVEMDFPYNGGSTATILLQKNTKSGKNVLFTVSKGQLLCDSYSGCNLSIRFDDKKPISVHAQKPGDYSSDALFLSGFDGLVKNMKSSKKMLIEATFYKNGDQTYSFDVSNLKFD